MIIFYPTLLFIIFHSVFPNKQERFIINILPFFIIGGIIGWQIITKHIDQKPRLRSWHKAAWVFFWLINIILLIPVSTMYSKKARVEAMVYLSKYDDLNYFLVEDVNKSILRFPPMFYLENWAQYSTLMEYDNQDAFKKAKKWKDPQHQPGFIIFMESKNIDERVSFMTSVFPGLEFETLIEPGRMDRLLHWLNPINDNQNIIIYRNSNVYPKQIDR